MNSTPTAPIGPLGVNGYAVAAVAVAFACASLADSPPDYAKAHEPPFAGSSSNVADGQLRIQISGATGAISAGTTAFRVTLPPGALESPPGSALFG